MTPDLDNLAKLLAAATPGEWKQGKHRPCITTLLGWFVADYVNTYADAALIVSLVNAAPALIAELKELREQNARLERRVTSGRQLLEGCREVHHRVERELQAARKVVEAAKALSSRGGCISEETISVDIDLFDSLEDSLDEYDAAVKPLGRRVGDRAARKGTQGSQL